ncbi:MAG: hypothetical protein ACLR0U_19655 [Enterocloster clostridioformis]
MDLYRIILVDDEEEVRQSIIRKIDWTGAGFCVVGDAENGEEALEKVEALEPDLILDGHQDAPLWTAFPWLNG